MYFAGFYETLIRWGCDLLRQRIRNQDALKNIFSDFKEHLVIRLQNMCIRTLIVEMHDYDNRGKLKGKDPTRKVRVFL